MVKNETSGAKSTLALTINLLITLVIGAIAGIFTSPQIRSWYVYLHKPSFNPPNWLFAPVWTILYLMIGISAYLVWKNRQLRGAYKRARLIYFVQLFFNFCWSIVFFGLHQVFLAVIVIVLLWASIIFNISAFNKLSRRAALLLVPYLLWVSFASVLNIAVYVLNR